MQLNFSFINTYCIIHLLHEVVIIFSIFNFLFYLQVPAKRAIINYHTTISRYLVVSCYLNYLLWIND